MGATTAHSSTGLHDGAQFSSRGAAEDKVYIVVFFGNGLCPCFHWFLPTKVRINERKAKGIAEIILDDKKEIDYLIPSNNSWASVSCILI